MLRFSDSGKHPLQTVRSEKFGKGALSKILRSQLQLRWGGHSLSFRLKKKRKTKPRTHRGCHIWALPISMSGSSFLLSVCPKNIGNVAKTLREVGTYELVQGTVTGDGAHVVGLLGRVFLPVLVVKYRDRVGLWSAKTVWESAPCFERDAFSGASV